MKIGGATLEGEALAALVDAIAFLSSIDLIPIVVHGSGPQLNQLLPDSRYEDGMRVTDEDTLRVCLRV